MKESGIFTQKWCDRTVINHKSVNFVTLDEQF